MKTAIILLLFCFTACNQKKNEKNTAEERQKFVEICFLSTGNKIHRENKILQDSTILRLHMEGGQVTGTYFWLPAEKDSRKGKLKAQKNGNSIVGVYTFIQEGQKETQPIQILLKENSATVITNKGQPGEMLMEIEKTACSY